jgi:hypothetical protein
MLFSGTIADKTSVSFAENQDAGREKRNIITAVFTL